MSLELPPASSLRRPRRAEPRPRAAAKVVAILAATAAIIAGTLALAHYGVSLLERPRLLSLEPSVGDPGGEVRLRGRNFGPARGDSSIDVDGHVPTETSYLEWSDDLIRLRLPVDFDSGLLRVVTRAGRSEPRLFMNRGRLPVLAAGSPRGSAGGAPLLSSLSPEEGLIGSLLTIVGRGFGESRSSSKVYFAWSLQNDGGLPGDPYPPGSVTPCDTDMGYESWSDDSLLVRVPDGAASGSVYVVSPRGRSNALSFRVSRLAGSKTYSARTSYSFTQTVSVNQVRTAGPGELFLWLPRPPQDSSQLVKVLAQEPEPMVGDYRGTSLFRLAGLETGRDISVSQSFLVQVFAVEAKVDAAGSSERPQNPPALMTAYVAADALVPAAAPAVRELAKKIVQGERGSWRAARLVWDWLVENLAWSENREYPSALDALAAGSADSYSYAIAACALLRAAGLPCLPVAGYLVDPTRKAARHYWVEVYLYGLGWVPLDPILGTGACPGGITPVWSDRSRYFGGVDARHLALSRGYAELAPMSPAGRRVSKARRWSFQSFYEEATGGLEAYSSYWGDIEVTGLY